MAATFEGNQTETALEKTLESTQEMNMETVATEQPQAIPSPAPQEQEENGEKTNGSMSASTESDGFEEGSPVNGEGEGGVGQEKVPEPMPKKTVKEERVIEQKPENRSPTKTSKSKRKEDKGIEHILKALSSLQSTEEKLAALCKKYADLHEDHRILQSSYKQTQRKLTVINSQTRRHRLFTSHGRQSFHVGISTCDFSCPRHGHRYPRRATSDQRRMFTVGSICRLRHKIRLHVLFQLYCKRTNYWRFSQLVQHV